MRSLEAVSVLMILRSMAVGRRVSLDGDKAVVLFTLESAAAGGRSFFFFQSGQNGSHSRQALRQTWLRFPGQASGLSW